MDRAADPEALHFPVKQRGRSSIYVSGTSFILSFSLRLYSKTFFFGKFLLKIYVVYVVYILWISLKMDAVDCDILMLVLH